MFFKVIKEHSQSRGCTYKSPFVFFPLWATEVLGLLRRNSKRFLLWVIQLVFLGLGLKMAWLLWLKSSERKFTIFQHERSNRSQNYKEMRPEGDTRRGWHQERVTSLRSALSSNSASQTKPAQSETLLLPKTSEGSTDLAPQHSSGFTAVTVFTTELKSGYETSNDDSSSQQLPCAGTPSQTFPGSVHLAQGAHPTAEFLSRSLFRGPL